MLSANSRVQITPIFLLPVTGQLPALLPAMICMCLRAMQISGASI
jgi:hypothetical protein